MIKSRYFFLMKMDFSIHFWMFYISSEVRLKAACLDTETS